MKSLNHCWKAYVNSVYPHQLLSLVMCCLDFLFCFYFLSKHLSLHSWLIFFSRSINLEVINFFQSMENHDSFSEKEEMENISPVSYLLNITQTEVHHNKKGNAGTRQASWCVLVILSLWRLKEEGHKCEDSLIYMYMEGLHARKKKKKKRRKNSKETKWKDGTEKYTNQTTKAKNLRQ